MRCNVANSKWSFKTKKTAFFLLLERKECEIALKFISLSYFQFMKKVQSSFFNLHGTKNVNCVKSNLNFLKL